MREPYQLAVDARDARFDGVFFVGITSTRVYCRPACKSRLAYDHHRRFFNSAAAAAWLPWCAAASWDVARARSLRARARAGAAAAIAFALQLLAGEPAISVLTLVFAGLLGLA